MDKGFDGSIESVSFNLFAATWNMGEGEPPGPAELSQWLVKGYQIYSIAVQECMHLELLIKNAQSCLGEKFQVFIVFG